MASSTSVLATLLLSALQAAKEAAANVLFNASSPAMLYANNPATTTGLTWGYIGGDFNDNVIANGTVALTNNATNYVVALRSSGAVSASTSTTDWNDGTNYARTYIVVTVSSAITTYTDKRQAIGFTSISSLRAPNIQTVSSSATVTPTFSNDAVQITAQAAGLTLANPTGTAIDMLGIVIRIKDNGTSRSITYGTQYRAIGVTLPSATVISKTLYLAMIFNNTDTKWDVLAVGQEA